MLLTLFPHLYTFDIPLVCFWHLICIPLTSHLYAFINPSVYNW